MIRRVLLAMCVGATVLAIGQPSQAGGPPSTATSASPTALPPSPAAVPARPEVVDPSRRVFMLTDSVGLGVRGVLQRALPEYQVTIDGFPALMVDQLDDRMAKPRVARNSTDIGDIAIIAAGYNYPYWDPARFDRD
ncbi:MAG TPA: hypothetical protein PLV68_01380, partial [Ilumatobacteraceae bacterium]|nr:hypothetical protein [Ilumatobacteraceae bacterium]